MALTEAQKLAFSRQVIEIVNINAAELLAANYDPVPMVTTLTTDTQVAEQKEAEQQTAQAAAKTATTAAVTTREGVYKDASQFVSLIEGLLGKGSHLVEELHKIRPLMNRSAKKENEE
jgi:hypothetical protein